MLPVVLVFVQIQALGGRCRLNFGRRRPQTSGSFFRRPLSTWSVVRLAEHGSMRQGTPRRISLWRWRRAHAARLARRAMVGPAAMAARPQRPRWPDTMSRPGSVPASGGRGIGGRRFRRRKSRGVTHLCAPSPRPGPHACQCCGRLKHIHDNRDRHKARRAARVRSLCGQRWHDSAGSAASHAQIEHAPRMAGTGTLRS